MAEMEDTKPLTRLYTNDLLGNTLGLIGTVVSHMKKQDAPREAVNAFREDATSGDFYDVLRAIQKHTTVILNDQFLGPNGDERDLVEVYREIMGTYSDPDDEDESWDEDE